ncbi:MAG TPA: NAD(P)/FAD-dependent oxidoreductase [Pricia sp.]|nr:NAD(P)/FAD-dependent oxidoreductase [Pricia sp.]
MWQYDVIVIGGGLAGLTAAIDLSQKGHRVLVFEKRRYPHHKVCGEYVSNEILPYLKQLGVTLDASDAVAITHLHLSTVQGKLLETELPLGGMGISRYAFDDLLYQRAVGAGTDFQFQNVISIGFNNLTFEVVTDLEETYTSTLVIGAYGKRSGLDKALNRDFASKKSSWLAVKAHYAYDDFPKHVVALHNFEGGYGGLSKTETGAVNFCYLASYSSFQREKDIDSFNTNVVTQNPFLNSFLREASPLFEEPLTIAQISFHPKKAIENHILMCGDTAGLIHPLCGNGMAMAIHSAKIAAELIADFLEKDNQQRAKLENDYQMQWNRHFQRRLWMGRRLQSLLLHPKMSAIALSAMVTQPRLLQKLIQSTHGKPI